MNSSDPKQFCFDGVAEAWERWEDWLERSYRGFNELLLSRTGITEGSNVLDLGCGSGFPALLAAEKVKPGSVIGVDISENMLDVARRRAVKLNIGNVQFLSQDIDLLPFPDQSFHAVTARFSMMFVKSVTKTLNEVYRVLTKGGRFVCSVWGDPQKNPLPRSIIQKYSEIPVESPDLPGPYRFATIGILRNFLKQAGFQNVTEEEVTIAEIFSDGDQFLQHIMESSVLWGTMLRNMSADTFAVVSREMKEAAEMYRDGEEIRVPRFALILTGTK